MPRRLQLVYLGSGDVVTYDPAEADLRAVERKLLALWEAIRLATETGDWRPRPTKLCGWCDHQPVCPEFGGTPPVYPLSIPAPGTPPPGEVDGEVTTERMGVERVADGAPGPEAAGRCRGEHRAERPGEHRGELRAGRSDGWTLLSYPVSDPE